jgi:uncharacterized protein
VPELSWHLPALLTVGFVSGFLNIVAGGGSLLTLPLLIFIGLPPTIANATNRVGILLQNVTAIGAFHRQGYFPWRVSLLCSAPALVGSWLGAVWAVDIDERFFQRLLALIMLGVLVITLIDPMKDRRAEPIAMTPVRTAALLVAFFFIGIYGGFVQAGVGFLILPVLLLMGFDLVCSNAVKIIVILLFTLPALAVFIWHDLVNWPLGLALGLGNAAGGWVASHMSVKKGHAWLKKVVSLVIVAFAIKLLID